MCMTKGSVRQICIYIWSLIKHMHAEAYLYRINSINQFPLALASLIFPHT